MTSTANTGSTPMNHRRTPETRTASAMLMSGINPPSPPPGILPAAAQQPASPPLEQAGVEGDGQGEAGEHEVCGVVEGVADGEVIAKGAVEDDLHREHRVDADEPQDDAGDEEGERDVDERDQRHVDPARDPAGGRAHSGFTAMAPGRPGLLWRASSSLAALAIMRPSIRSLASAAGTSPTMRPSNITRMRPPRELISSSQTRTSRTALPPASLAPSIR